MKERKPKTNLRINNIMPWQKINNKPSNWIIEKQIEIIKDKFNFHHGRKKRRK